MDSQHLFLQYLYSHDDILPFLCLLLNLKSGNLYWKMTWFSSAASSLLHKNQHTSSREIWTCLWSFSLFLSFSLSLSYYLSLCCLFYLSTVKASQALLGFVVRNLYLPKGGISDWHRQPLSSLPSRKQCSPLLPEETSPSFPHPSLLPSHHTPTPHHSTRSSFRLARSPG